MASETPRQGRRRAAIKPAETTEAAEQAEQALNTGKGRATPGRRQQQTEEEAPRGIVGRTVDYLQGVRSELNKVAWPNREQVITLFRNVLIVTILAAIILGAISFGFNELFAIGLSQPIVFVVFGAIVAGLTFYFTRRGDPAAS
jgi:preprotein translocase SecE subunit